MTGITPDGVAPKNPEKATGGGSGSSDSIVRPLHLARRLWRVASIAALGVVMLAGIAQPAIAHAGDGRPAHGTTPMCMTDGYVYAIHGLPFGVRSPQIVGEISKTSGAQYQQTVYYRTQVARLYNGSWHYGTGPWLRVSDAEQQRWYVHGEYYNSSTGKWEHTEVSIVTGWDGSDPTPRSTGQGPTSGVVVSGPGTYWFRAQIYWGPIHLVDRWGTAGGEVIATVTDADNHYTDWAQVRC